MERAGFQLPLPPAYDKAKAKSVRDAKKGAFSVDGQRYPSLPRRPSFEDRPLGLAVLGKDRSEGSR